VLNIGKQLFKTAENYITSAGIMPASNVGVMEKFSYTKTMYDLNDSGSNKISNDRCKYLSNLDCYGLKNLYLNIITSQI